jgi:hypothetical protein
VAKRKTTKTRTARSLKAKSLSAKKASGVKGGGKVTLAKKGSSDTPSESLSLNYTKIDYKD